MHCVRISTLQPQSLPGITPNLIIFLIQAMSFTGAVVKSTLGFFSVHFSLLFYVRAALMLLLNFSMLCSTLCEKR